MKKIEVAVILGAGFGKRLTPITNEIPKPLVEIGNETILEKTIKLIKKLNLKPNQRVLDIGCGWGTLAIDIAKKNSMRSCWNYAI